MCKRLQATRWWGSILCRTVQMDISTISITITSLGSSLSGPNWGCEFSHCSWANLGQIGFSPIKNTMREFTPLTRAIQIGTNPLYKVCVLCINIYTYALDISSKMIAINTGTNCNTNILKKTSATISSDNKKHCRITVRHDKWT